jgi:hypothetical protein
VGNGKLTIAALAGLGMELWGWWGLARLGGFGSKAPATLVKDFVFTKFAK